MRKHQLHLARRICTLDVTKVLQPTFVIDLAHVISPTQSCGNIFVFLHRLNAGKPKYLDDMSQPYSQALRSLAKLRDPRDPTEMPTSLQGKKRMFHAGG